MPAGIARLTSLRTLKKFVVGWGADGSPGCSFECLECLNLLRECRIEGLGKVLDVDEAKRSQLVNKKNLSALELSFDDSGEERRRRKNEDDEQLLEALQLHPNLELLTIRYYGGNSFPGGNWMTSLTNLRDLNLAVCENCKRLPALGKLPSLEKLSVWRLGSVKRVGNEILGIESGSDHIHASSSSSSVTAFPKLKSPRFYGMTEWEEWDDEITRNGEIMPRLSLFVLYDCAKLKALPDYLVRKTTLQELTIAGCPILKERYKESGGEDWPRISHIPEIRFHL